MVSRVLLGLLATVSVAGSADAALSLSYNFYATTRNPGSVNQFDPRTGTLTSIEIAWSGTAVTAFENPYTPFQPYTVTYGGGVGYQLFPTGITDSKGVSGTKLCPASQDCAAFVTASGTTTFGSDSRFVGTGTLPVFSFGYVSVTGGGREEYMYEYQTVQGTVTYFFDAAAPEPATWAMMVAGFGMVGSAMRSRRRAMVAFA